MVDVGVDYREAVDGVTQCRDLGLRKFELSDHEREVLGELRDVLKILKDATLYFSRGSTYIPTMNAMKEQPAFSIPNLASAMDLMDREFTSYAHDPSYSAPIRASIELAQKTLSRYYSSTDKSTLYRIAMALHPHYKLAYFKNTH
ncbi:hypothetical protein SCLCIDRAFT_119312 [Scleroderma citrinum Foug A]|uniref:Uncharacterized protein n=1 Tax=Scleroderma citrinum Foug A TaxID=1036808 RepID=A0A0C3DPS2_9AGAM|nr:hypothetical protein SCLCIDRAFT_119312 [Scleroderma citrinum Foug A]